MFELRDVTFSYGEQPVLDHVDLAIDHGELVLLAGPTGVGKSTLLGVVAGLVPAFTGGTLTGDVVIDGESVLEVPARERAHVVGYVGQNPPAWFVTDSVEEELAFGMEQLGLAAPTMRRRVEETLDLLGIADLRHRDLRTLSGGQQQRVAIGSVLTTHPRLLVLDEPTSALDPTAAEDVLATLTRLVHDLGRLRAGRGAPARAGRAVRRPAVPAGGRRPGPRGRSRRSCWSTPRSPRRWSSWAGSPAGRRSH